MQEAYESCDGMTDQEIYLNDCKEYIFDTVLSRKESFIPVLTEALE